jgi:Tol biopolymer transport system component
MVFRRGIRFHRERGLPPLVLGLIGFAVGFAAISLLLAPRVVAVRPRADEAAGAFAPIMIRFSVPMEEDSVAAHLRLSPEMSASARWEGTTLQLVPAAPWPTGSEVRISLSLGARSRNGLPLLRSYQWRFSPAGLRVLYLRRTAETYEIVVQPLEGEAGRALVESTLPILEYDISPSGTFLVYTVGASDKQSDLWYLALDGSAPYKLLDCEGEQCRNPAIAADGRQLAYDRAVLAPSVGGIVSAQRPRVWILDLEDGRARAVGDAAHAARAPVWGPQGWLAYYDGDLQTTVVDDLRGGRTYVPNASGEVGVWTPDGAHLIFPEIRIVDEHLAATPTIEVMPSASATPALGAHSDAIEQFYSHLIYVTLATNESTDLSSSPLVEDANVAISPEGDRLAFGRKYLDAEHWSPGRQLWVMDRDGTRARQLTFAPVFNVSSIRWSPDGSLVLFMRFDQTHVSLPPEVWVTTAAGENPRQLAVGAYLPRWLP